mgnify:CR=1 FL=1
MRGDDGFDGAVGPRRPVGAVRVTVSAPHVTDASAAAGVTDNQESRAQARRGALFLSAVVGAYLAYLTISGQMGTFADALSSVDAGWVLRACLCFASYWVFGVLAYVIAVYLDHDSPVGVRDLMSVEASGVFFGNLTPMMAGAVPAQIYRLTRTGLDVGEASATQFTRFIMFQLGVVLFAAVMLVAKAGYFLEAYGDIFLLNLVVFGVHFLELAGIFVVCLCPRFVMRVGNGAIALADRHGWLRESARWDEMVNVQVMEFSNAFRRAASDLPSMGLTLLVTMAQEHPRLLDLLLFSPAALAALDGTGRYPLLDLVRGEVARMAARHDLDATTLFTVLWAFIQGYSRLVATGAATYDTDLLRQTMNTFTMIGKRP